jgi:hypothetical protein
MRKFINFDGNRKISTDTVAKFRRPNTEGHDITFLSPLKQHYWLQTET